jgi:hypothetical protein
VAAFHKANISKILQLMSDHFAIRRGYWLDNGEAVQWNATTDIVFPKLPYWQLIENLSDLGRHVHLDARALDRQSDGLLAKRSSKGYLGRSF